MNPRLEQEIRRRFGVLPNFFRLTAGDLTITANLWGFAKFGYLDNPLPSLFKERLFVYLSRFCPVRYCIARHLGFLIGLGHPAGDADCLPQTVNAVLPLLQRPLPHGNDFSPHLAFFDKFPVPLSSYPEPDTGCEISLFACATHVFLQTPEAARAHDTLRTVLKHSDLEYLKVFLAFVRTAHYWTRIHTELVFEDDIRELLAVHRELADCILRDPQARSKQLGRQVAADLASLRELAAHEAAQQRLLLERVLVAQDEERRRVARELHDEAGQLLTSLLTCLARLDDSRSVAASKAIGRQMRETVARTMDELACLARGLHPAALTDHGLHAAVTSYVEDYERLHGIVVRLTSDGPAWRSLPDAAALSLYRIIQEALTNVVKHANARTVDVSLKQASEALQISIADDGRGFDLTSLHRVPAKHLGLRGIQERSLLLGGVAKFRSGEMGTEILVQIPAGVARNPPLT